MNDLTLPLEPGQVYHLYNRGIDRQAIFFSEAHYKFFLDRYRKYLTNYFETFAYCLLPNHFHLMVGVKPLEEILLHLDKDFNRLPSFLLKKVGIEGKELANFNNLWSLTSAVKALEEEQTYAIVNWLVSERMRRFLMSYAKAVNKQLNRSGSLFQKTFRRRRIDDEVYFTQLIGYIHRNPVHHNLDVDYAKYPWSSYRSFISEQPTQLSRAAVLEWFGGQEAFIQYHDCMLKDHQEKSFWIE